MLLPSCGFTRFKGLPVVLEGKMEIREISLTRCLSNDTKGTRLRTWSATYPRRK